MQPRWTRGGYQTYSVTRLDHGQKTTVSTSDLAPFPRSQAIAEQLTSDIASNHTTPSGVENVLSHCRDDPPPAAEKLTPLPEITSPSSYTDSFPSPPRADVQPLRRSTRLRKPLIVSVIGPNNYEREGEWRFWYPRSPALIASLIDYVLRRNALLCLIGCIARQYQIVFNFVIGGCCVYRLTLQMFMRSDVPSWIKPGERFRSPLGPVVTLLMQ